MMMMTTMKMMMMMMLDLHDSNPKIYIGWAERALLRQGKLHTGSRAAVDVFK